MVLIFIAPSTRHPSGGVAMIYEYASAMAARGHVVHLYHVDFFEADVAGPEDISWFSFSETVIHHFPDGPVDPTTIPAADAIFGFTSEATHPPQTGQPLVLIQGYKMLGAANEQPAFLAPCPKVCVASWLVEVGREMGAPPDQLVHVPLGLRHDKYRLTRPIAGRPPRVTFCYSAHPQKGADLALAVLADVKRAAPEVEVTAFGAMPPSHAIPVWAEYRENPSQAELVEDIYNGSRVFLCTSEVEGFGLTLIEAMACGATLVTTDNGGSRDYAFHDRTALVAPTGAHDLLVEGVVGLLRDDERRVALGAAGNEFVQRFVWERTGEILEGFLNEYLADPVRYGRPAERVVSAPGGTNGPDEVHGHE